MNGDEQECDGSPSTLRTLLEPILGIEIRCPIDMIGTVAGVISSKRGKMLNVDQKEIVAIVTGEIPVSETFDLSESYKLNFVTLGELV